MGFDMAGKKNNKSRTQRNKQNGAGSTQRNNQAAHKKTSRGIVKFAKRAVQFLLATGVLTLLASFAYDFLTGDVQVKYLKPSGRGYEFQLSNNNSVDQVIDEFRIKPDPDQQFIFKIDKDIYANVHNGGVTIPGGNTTYMPAYEFKEMDGYELGAKSEVNFRIPPLVARDYMVPEYIVVFAEYKTSPKNPSMKKIASFLTRLHLREPKQQQKYLIVDNYWTPISNGNVVNAIQTACRDDDVFAQSETCRAYLKN